MSERDVAAKGISRRLFLGLVGVLAGLPRSAWALLKDRFPVRTVEKGGWAFEPESGVIRYGKDRTEPFRLKVDGLVEEPVSFSYEELKAMPQVEQVSDFHCVEGWSVYDLRWSGVRFEEIMKRVEVKDGANYAVFHALGETEYAPYGQGHYIESHSVEKLLDPRTECLLVLNLDGEPLSHDHGAPLRLIAPYDLAYKNIKYVERIEFSDQPQAGWWTLANPIYPIDAPVPEGRLRKK